MECGGEGAFFQKKTCSRSTFVVGSLVCAAHNVASQASGCPRSSLQRLVESLEANGVGLMGPIRSVVHGQHKHRVRIVVAGAPIVTEAQEMRTMDRRTPYVPLTLD